MIRSFVAIPMPEDTAARLAGAVRGLAAGRRVPEENLHLTLVFLGEATEAQLEELHDGLSAIRLPPVELSFEGFGSFGEGSPRALWAGVAATPGLGALQARVERAARAAGLSPERRRFRPHVTLARFRGLPAEAAALRAHLERVPFPQVPPVRAVGFSLMASDLRPEGAVYSEMALYPLMG